MGAVAGSPYIELQQRIVRLVAEGLQELEHASFVRAQMHEPGNGLDYAITRRGRVALGRGRGRGHPRGGWRVAADTLGALRCVAPGVRRGDIVCLMGEIYAHEKPGPGRG